MLKVEIGNFLKCPKGFFLDMGTVSIVTQEIVNYHPDMRWKEEDVPWIPQKLIDSHEAQDRGILLTGRPSSATSLLQCADGLWHQIHTTKWRTPEGNLAGESVIQSLELMYYGWAQYLDHAKKQLRLPDGSVLSAKDLTLLHRFLMGMPRKEMAARFFVTVKAIEKRLTRLREQLDHPGCVTLHDGLHRLSLIPFLLAHANWFELSPSHHVHK